MTTEIKILIADDHPIFRGGLKSVIEKERGLRVVAEAETGAAALELIKEYQPDVAVLDLDMPEMDGFAVARELQILRLPVSVVILTMHKDELHFNRAIDLNVRGFVIKDGAAAEVVGCIKSVAAGKEYFSPVLSSFLLSRARRVSSFAGQAGVNDLTPTERRVLSLLAELKTSKDIAATLGVSPRTVENHRAHICSKLNLQGSHALTKFAIQHKQELS
ncbi:MAG TPA: response regulator transcription factor [Pyrinomonadaceae bacterium]|jgi:DNA-binding NarL/FixJ family response regulator